MQWINNFTAYRIPFYIYKLKDKDCLIYTDNDKLNHTIIILNGILLILKIFTNGEKLCIAILSKNNIINIKTNNLKIKPYYYQAIALEKTWIMSFKSNYIYTTSPIIIKNFFQSYSLTVYQYEIINQILIHKEAKNRMIQAIIYLGENFGYIQNKYIIIRCHIDQLNFSLMIGTNKVTINKIIKKLQKDLIIKYYKNRIICIYKI